jgi:hypothetical protein
VTISNAATIPSVSTTKTHVKASPQVMATNKYDQKGLHVIQSAFLSDDDVEADAINSEAENAEPNIPFLRTAFKSTASFDQSLLSESIQMANDFSVDFTTASEIKCNPFQETNN